MQRNCPRKYFECPDETLQLARYGEIIYKYITQIHSFESTYPLNTRYWVAWLYDTDSLYDLRYILQFMTEKTSLLAFSKTKKIEIVQCLRILMGMKRIMNCSVKSF